MVKSQLLLFVLNKKEHIKVSVNILNDKDIMLNREIGLVQFYRRVLAKTTIRHFSKLPDNSFV